VYTAQIDYDQSLKTLLKAQSINDTKEIQNEIVLIRKYIAQKRESDKKVRFYQLKHYLPLFMY
jgi:hypothetical protein